MKFKTPPMRLGFDPTGIVKAVAPIFGGGSKKSGASGTPPMNINPTFQQQFTPQFSPTLQQQQDSPGATQGASPVQYATGGQTATPGAPSVPGAPSIGIPAYVPPSAQRPVIQSSDNMGTLIKWGVLGIGAIALIQTLGKNQRRKNGQTKSTSKALVKR